MPSAEGAKCEKHARTLLVVLIGYARSRGRRRTRVHIEYVIRGREGVCVASARIILEEKRAALLIPILTSASSIAVYVMDGALASFASLEAGGEDDNGDINIK